MSQLAAAASGTAAAAATASDRYHRARGSEPASFSRADGRARHAHSRPASPSGSAPTTSTSGSPTIDQASSTLAPTGTYQRGGASSSRSRSSSTGAAVPTWSGRFQQDPSRSLLRARRWSCRACTPATQSQPSLADGPTRGSLEHRRHAGRARTPDPGRSVRVPDQLRRWTRGRGRGHRRRPPRPRAAAARRGSPRSGPRCRSGRASESGHRKACRRRREPRVPRSAAPHGPGHAPDARQSGLEGHPRESAPFRRAGR
jgi:hypothetical protein